MIRNLFFNVKPQAMLVEIGIFINPSPEADNVTEVEVVTIPTKVSTGFK